MEPECEQFIETGGDKLKQNVVRDNIDASLKIINESKKPWMFFIFCLTAFPGLLNGMHIMSYVFFVDNHPHYCDIPLLEKSSWTLEQIVNISTPGMQSPQKYGCEYYNYNYTFLSTLSFEEALNYVHWVKTLPEVIPCQKFKYENTDSVVSEWDLICDRYYYRTHIQSAYALGKFVGASFFGVLADEYGRRFSFSLAALSFAISAASAVILNNFYLFLFIRFFIGFGAVGCYATAYTLLSELYVGSSKTWVCCSFNVSFAIGMMILAAEAYYIHYWRTLMIVISVPTIILPAFYWILPESPQWLLSQKRYEDACKVLQKIDPATKSLTSSPKIDQPTDDKPKINLSKKLMEAFTKIGVLFSNSLLAVRTSVSFFVWFTIAIMYYGLAFNGDNFKVNQYAYIAFNGLLEMCSYLLSIPLLNFFGRKGTSLLLFTFIGCLLISIMFVPKDYGTIIVILALLGRFLASAAYVIFVLFTSELFPTAIRNTAIGASLTMGHVGTFVSPYIVDILGAYKWYLPSTIIGLFSVASIFLVCFLPETKNQPSYNNIHEMMSRNEPEHD